MSSTRQRTGRASRLSSPRPGVPPGPPPVPDAVDTNVDEGVGAGAGAIFTYVADVGPRVGFAARLLVTPGAAVGP